MSNWQNVVCDDVRWLPWVPNSGQGPVQTVLRHCSTDFVPVAVAWTESKYAIDEVALTIQYTNPEFDRRTSTFGMF